MSHALHVAVLGKSLVSGHRNRAASAFRGLLRAMVDRGHRVTFLQPDDDGDVPRDLPDPLWARVRRWRGEEDLLAALDEVADADVVVRATGWGVGLADAAVVDGRRPGQHTVLWDVSAGGALARMEADPDDTIRSALPRYDLVLGSGDDDAWQRMGARRFVSLPFAVDPAAHRPPKTDGAEPFAADVAFLGNPVSDRDDKLARWLDAVVASGRTAVVGGDFDGVALPEGVRRVGYVPVLDHGAFYASARVILDLGRRPDSLCPSTRLFEAAGVGVCVVAEARDGIDQLFEPGREVLLARDEGELVAILDGLDDDAARAIGQAARARALRDHTWMERAVLLEDALSHLDEEAVRRAG